MLCHFQKFKFKSNFECFAKSNEIIFAYFCDRFSKLKSFFRFWTHYFFKFMRVVKTKCCTFLRMALKCFNIIQSPEHEEFKQRRETVAKRTAQDLKISNEISNSLPYFHRNKNLWMESHFLKTNFSLSHLLFSIIIDIFDFPDISFRKKIAIR